VIGDEVEQMQERVLIRQGVVRKERKILDDIGHFMSWG